MWCSCWKVHCEQCTLKGSLCNMHCEKCTVTSALCTGNSVTAQDCPSPLHEQVADCICQAVTLCDTCTEVLSHCNTPCHSVRPAYVTKAGGATGRHAASVTLSHSRFGQAADMSPSTFAHREIRKKRFTANLSRNFIKSPTQVCKHGCQRAAGIHQRERTEIQWIFQIFRKSCKAGRYKCAGVRWVAPGCFHYMSDEVCPQLLTRRSARSAVQCNEVQYSAVQCNTVQYSTVQCNCSRPVVYYLKR